MKLIGWDVLVDDGFARSGEFDTVRTHITEAIDGIKWPPGNSIFAIYPQSGKKRGEGNGVRPIKDSFVSHLKDNGWHTEVELFDVHYTFPHSSTLPFAAEWETGNISSSHRSINRMGLGMMQGSISGGVLVVPSRSLARFLTDRIGNAEELYRYYPLWRAWSGRPGYRYLALVTVEHDAEDWGVPRISKSTDGRALS